VAHGVDALVHQVKSADCEPVLNRVLSNPKLEQLPASDHAVLPPGQGGYLRIEAGLTFARPRQTAYIAVSRGLGRHGLSLAGKFARVVRGLRRLSYGMRA
jgi:hypothetical protein